MRRSRRLPWMKFFPNDWLGDHTVTLLSPASRGIWIDLLCVMSNQPARGIVTGTVEQLARLARCSGSEMENFLHESEHGLCDTIRDGNGLVTLKNRRMLRDEKARKQTAERVARHRRNKVSNGVGSAPVQEMSRGETRSQTPEARSKEKNIKRKNPDLVRWFEETFVPAYPEHRQGSQRAGALAELRNLKPNSEARAAIIVHLELWKVSPDWQKDRGEYVPGMGNFFRNKFHERKPEPYRAPDGVPASRNGSQVRPIPPTAAEYYKAADS